MIKCVLNYLIYIDWCFKDLQGSVWSINFTTYMIERVKLKAHKRVAWLSEFMTNPSKILIQLKILHLYKFNSIKVILNAIRSIYTAANIKSCSLPQKRVKRWTNPNNKQIIPLSNIYAFIPFIMSATLSVK